MYEPLLAAARIGERLARQAVWSGPQCAWRAEMRRKEKSLTASCERDATLYRGSGGIGLFLAELAAKTDDVMVLRAARGALQHAVSALPAASSPWSVFSGALGIVYALARLAKAHANEQALEQARTLWYEKIATAPISVAADVIIGAAGAIPILLQLEGCVDSAAITDCVRRLAAKIAASALHTTDGVCWRGTTIAVRPLTGCAHGASGYAYALLAAWLRTGNAEYFYLAHQALLYERSVYDSELQNWPDFRHSQFGRVVWEMDPADLRALVRGGWTPGPYQRHGMTAWCHGAPGIGYVRLRAYEILKHPWLRREAQLAASLTAASLPDLRNWSLCHGVAGNAEFLLAAATSLEGASDRAIVERCAAEGFAAYEANGRPWPSGAPDNLSHPSLMLGDAGIGMHFLRLHDPSIPSILLPPLPIPTQPPHNNAAPCRRAIFETMFSRTSVALQRRADRPSVVEVIGDWSPCSTRSDVAAMRRRVRTLSRRTRSKDLATAAWRDLQSIELSDLQYSDLQAMLDDLNAIPWHDVSWANTLLRLRGSVVIREERRPRVLRASSKVLVRPNGTNAYLTCELTPASALILPCYRLPRTMAVVFHYLSERIGHPDCDALQRVIERQTRLAYANGLLTCAPTAPDNLCARETSRSR